MWILGNIFFWISSIILFVVLGFSINEIWRYYKSDKDRTNIAIQILSICIGILVFRSTIADSRTTLTTTLERNRVLSLCQYRGSLANEMVTLLSNLSNQVQYKNDIPNTCYKRDGSDVFINNPIALEFAEKSRIDWNVLNFKATLLGDEGVLKELGKYQESIINFQEQCSAKPGFNQDEFKQARYQITQTENKVTSALNNMIAICFN